MGMRPLPRLQRRGRASLRRRATGARCRARPRRRAGGVHAGAVPAPHRPARRARPGRRGAAGRRGADALSRDPPRPPRARAGDERGRDRRRRARSRRSPAPEGAQPGPRRRRGPPRRRARGGDAQRRRRGPAGSRTGGARAAAGGRRSGRRAGRRLRRQRRHARTGGRRRRARRARRTARAGRRDVPDALRRRPARDLGDLLELGHARGAGGGRRAGSGRRHRHRDRAGGARRRTGRLRPSREGRRSRPPRGRTGARRSVMTLAGKIAVVTGGGSGIGEAICHRLAADGARVAAIDVRLDAAFARVERELGVIDILVNNAGAVGGAHLARVMPLLETQRLEALSGGVQTPLDALVRLSDDEWRRLLAVHLDGTFFCTRAAARLMAPRGSGVIVNMASVCGIEGCTGHPHYSAAKAAILGFTRAVAKELIVQGIRVNAVAPGHVDTGALKDTLDESRRVVAARTPAGRLARPEEIAATVAFLASDDAAYYVGATLGPNGGLVTAV